MNQKLLDTIMDICRGQVEFACDEFEKVRLADGLPEAIRAWKLNVTETHRKILEFQENDETPPLPLVLVDSLWALTALLMDIERADITIIKGADNIILWEVADQPRYIMTEDDLEAGDELFQ